MNQTIVVPALTSMPKAPWLKFAMGLFGILAVFTSYRLYQHATAFSMGMDSFEPEFGTYWMTLLYVQLPVLTFGGLGVIARLWFTRERHPEKVTAFEELRRYYVLLSLILAFAIVAYLTASVFTEIDAAWHQIAIRDSDFTPTHIALFYFGIPCFIFSGLFAFVYAHTRLPVFMNRVSLPFALVVAGPIMIMPNVGFNEWGHTFFYAEELFAAPIHWGFVLLGWATFAAGGLVVQMLTRIVQLTKVIAKPVA
ncbi:MAG: methane monooxygenase/ammonia monooxygenase subunit C [Panacagrimonas sp.]